MRRNPAGNAVRLKHLKTVAKPNGRTFTYLAIPGHKMVRLPDSPRDSADFLMAYAAAMASADPLQKGRKHAPGSIAAAVSAYQCSPAFIQLASSTKDQRRRHLSRIADVWGSAKLADLRAAHIEADIGKLAPHPANNRLKTWRGLLSWSRETRAISKDPSAEVKKRSIRKTDGFTPWTKSDVEKFREHWAIGTPQRLAMELAYWTAARAADLVRLGPGMVTRDGWLTFRQEKTGGEVSIPFFRALPSFASSMAADLAYLKDAIAAAPRHMTWLVTAHGTSRSKKAFSSWFSQAATEAGIATEKSAHGLRKARAQALAEAGATGHQIAAWTGHETLSEVQRYSKAADRRRMLTRAEPEQLSSPGQAKA
ncbi:tyrosine-type recombinase/integrase [Paracoccus tibetensis]|uniref:Site-specific recombinase XerD n=1 Tax=Paracoccus tibetensis TaxID=336292 RepID=A0A1G5BGS6_9RHOB|nr:tyrosine-type recombinase/integrase [Paracoccus tibetensis]SCX89336.1 Site-specific recombinase XerD [Paracoccus tibetensis]